MGQASSRPNSETSIDKDVSVSQIIDYIATHYILTMDFKSLQRLYQKEYCDSLVILTSDIVDRYFTDREITYLAQRVKQGVEVNEMEQDKVVFFNKEAVDKLNVSNSLKKKRLCIGISKFYVKVAHIFAAIVMTINPVYMYKDEEGNTIKQPFSKKDKIPPHVKKELFKLNVCSNRIDDLTGKQDLKTFNSDNVDGSISVHPKVCSINVDMEGNPKTLMEEPGIRELMELYLDSDYNTESGKFLGMSPESRKQYESDLRLFYSVFTDSEDAPMPDTIKSFSDIKLRDYQSQPGCRDGNKPFHKSYRDSMKNPLFAEYAKNIRRLVKSANEKQEKLLTVINKLFTYVIDPNSKNKRIIIHPELTEMSLQEIIKETRSLIIDLYLSCEINYVKGIKIFEAIVESKILETTQRQITTLEKSAEALYVPDVEPTVATKPIAAELIAVSVTAHGNNR